MKNLDTNNRTDARLLFFLLFITLAVTAGTLFSPLFLTLTTDSFSIQHLSGNIGGFDINVAYHKLHITIFLIWLSVFLVLFIYSGMPSALVSRAGLIPIIFITFGICFIVQSYSEFNHTYDEIAHIGAGMEWWGHGTYNYEPMHPPLARLAAATLPHFYHLGPDLQMYRQWDMWTIGEHVLNAKHTIQSYINHLSLARMGILPFYILLGLVVWAWGYRLAGSKGAVATIIVFASIPMLAGHAGLATTDFPYTAMFVTACYCLVLTLEKPSAINFVLLGIAAALTVASKLSALIQLPSALLFIATVHFLFSRKTSGSSGYVTDLIKQSFLIALPAFVFTIAAAYQFSEWQAIPRGLSQALDKNNSNHSVWFMGKALHDQPELLYFPVGFFYKSQLPFLLLVVIGTGAGIWNCIRHKHFTPLHPFLAAAGVLIGTMFLSNVNIGIRHILPMFGLLCVTAGYGLATMLPAFRVKYIANYVVAGALLGWQYYGFIAITPDQFTYFNEFAGDHPEEILIDTDLDWGQDLLRLRKEVYARHIPALYLCYFGTADSAAVLGITVLPCPAEKLSGWVAVSHYAGKIGTENFWVYREVPQTLVGRSINLYYIP